MIQDTFVIYSSRRAAADMFEAINLIPEQMNFHGLYYVDEETNLEMAALHAILMTGYEIM